MQPNIIPFFDEYLDKKERLFYKNTFWRFKIWKIVKLFSNLYKIKQSNIYNCSLKTFLLKGHSPNQI